MKNNSEKSASYFIKSILSIILLTSVVFCMEEEKTSKKPSHVIDMDLTAGKEVAQKQKEIFTEENFLKVFKPQEIQKLDINWQAFQDGDFDEPGKRSAISKITKFMLLNTKNTQEFKQLDGELDAINKDQQRVHLRRVNDVALEYFQLKFSDFAVDIGYKLGGVQLGNTVTISKESEKSITYHVKTHSDGLASGKSAAATIVNPVELMVYKILERIGIGCESHFFGRDAKNFYIATKDTGFDGTYLSYGKMKEEHSNFSNSEEFSNGIFCLDLLSRILRLTDLQTNSGNFGFVNKSDGWHIKAIDFRVVNEQNFKINKEYFQGFLEGNTQVSYSDEPIKNIFKKHKDLEQIARNIFSNQFKNFYQIVKESAQEVFEAIKNNVKEQTSAKDLQNMKEALFSYTEAIEYNFNVFCKELKII